ARAWNRRLGAYRAPRRQGAGADPRLARHTRGPDHGGRHLPAERGAGILSRDSHRSRRHHLCGRGVASPRPQRGGDRLGAPCAGAGAMMKSKPLYLKPRGATELVVWEEIAVDAPEVGRPTSLDDAQFVALDVETTGNAPFLVLEIGAERFRLDRTLSFFDTLVDCRAPINPYARRRHHIDRSMLIGAPEFKDARRGFLRFAQGAVLVEHSHDAFDTWLVGRGLESPLEHPIIDTTALAR